jgi:glucose/arabinose dehydrogenase
VRFRLACVALALAALPLLLGVSPAGAVAAQESTETHDLPGGSITLPTGFTIGVYASDVGQARFMAVRPSDGVLFVADANGRILALPDANHDGAADDVIVFASGLNQPSSIAFYQDWLYVGEANEIVRFPAPNNAMQPQGDTEVVIPNLPPPTDHWTRTISFGPDGKLYLAIGSSCNVCNNSDSRRAAISVYDPDGKNGHLFATGLRNAVGFTWQPGTNQMWATVNGRDSIGDNIPPDELRIVRDGSFNGWPYCYNGTTPNPEYGDPSLCTSAVPAEVALPAHSAALGITFGDQFAAPQPYKESVYIAYHGSWNRSVKTGYKVVRVPFVDGKAGQPEDFATGWLPGSADNPGQVWGRPVGVTIGSDGALYVTDDDGGRVYRIAATG